ncbi:ATPase, T2SS/T4P/T4SS family [Amphibiibacter pelophylacis]|uniref:ATPase, T2SS/T4P/T4SS family n=1 Tax=Amphibiibacter pelophylacis TaxID=1799477 RepID=A0ACC6NZH7_9BURK
MSAPNDVWPTPPYSSFVVTPLTEGEPCVLEGMNGQVTSARLIDFLPAEGRIRVQVPPSRNAMGLRFEQFRRLTLSNPLRPVRESSADPHSRFLDHRPELPVHIDLGNGKSWEGLSVGQNRIAQGIFLYEPVKGSQSVTRHFWPNSAFAGIEVGPRLGEVLVSSQTATPNQIERALSEQQAIRQRKIGDILMAKAVVTQDDLMSALDQQSAMPIVRIGEALVALGSITASQLDEALRQQQEERNVPLGELLVRSSVISRHDLQVALARKMGYPVVDLAAFPIEIEAVRTVPYAVAKRVQALPLVVRTGRVVVAMEDPSKRDAINDLEFIGQIKVAPVIAQTGTLDSAIDATYERFKLKSAVIMGGMPGNEPEMPDSGALLARLEQEKDDGPGNDTDDRTIEQSDNSLVKLINSMILEAHGQGVSDIHIECRPGREKVQIRFRKDGRLKNYLELPHTYRNALIARLKIMCDLDISERRKPQDGKINFAKFIPGQAIELRLASIPTSNGLEDIVMRILASAKPVPLEKLGLSPRNLRELQAATERPYGMVLCVGPTGSGKTTTLHSALSYINTPDRKIWTAEDPVEITQAGLRQVQVNPKIDWTFARALKAFLRADPDVIMVGEIRDSETASIAVEASLTGHLVMSTLHTNSAPETVTRLLDMGMDPFNFADSLLAVLAQRLIRRLCPRCVVKSPAPEEYIKELLDDYLHVIPPGQGRPSKDVVRAQWEQNYAAGGPLVRYHSPGCPHCENTGFKGRAGLHELMIVDRDLRKLIQGGSRAEELQACAINGGMRTLRQDGIEKVLQGVTTIEEVRAISNNA